MSSALATPSSTIRMASIPMAIPRRDDANPGKSRTSMGSLPMRRASPSAVSAAASEVASVRTTSTSFMMCTGLKKCIPTTRSGCAVASAIFVMDSDEVFVASTTEASRASPSFPKIDVLRSMRSGTASTTNWTPSIAASRSVVPLRFASAASRASSVTLPRATPFSRFAATLARPASTASSATS